MQDLLESRYKRRVFLFIAFLFITSLVLVRFFITPSDCVNGGRLCNVGNQLLDSLLVSSTSAVFIAVLIFVLTPKDVRRAGLRVIDPHEIRRLLDDARAGVNRYWFAGNSGRYTRAVTLPNLAESARAENTTKELTILLIDPTDTVACQGYADYRGSLRSASSKGKWNAEMVRNESYATIISAYCWVHEQPRLDVRVCLRKHFSMFRSDISTKTAVITKEDPQEPGIHSDSGSFFYDAFLEDLRLNVRQARELSRTDKTFGFASLNSVAAVREFLKGLGLPELIDQDLNDIIALVKNRENPYEPSFVARVFGV